MSQELAASRAPESGVTSAGLRRSPSPTPSSSGSCSDGDAIDAIIDVFCRGDDPLEDEIEDAPVDELLRGASPAVRRQVAAQREELRAREEALRREVARSRAESARRKAEMRRRREYTDLLCADLSGYTDAQRAEHKRELERRSRQLLSGGG